MEGAANIGGYPLHRSQRLIWMSERLIRDARVNNMAFRYDIYQELDQAAFARSFQLLVQEADCLRMKYRLPVGEELPVLVVEGNFSYELPLHDFSNEADPEKACTHQLQELTSQGFEEDEFLFSAGLYRLGQAHYVLYFNQHHFITDGSSLQLQLSWLCDCYQQLAAGRSEPKDLPRLGSFAAYLQQRSQQQPTEKLLAAQAHWEELSERLVPAPKFLGRTNARLEPASTAIKRKLDASTVAALKKAIQAEDVRSISDDLSIVGLLSTVCYAFAYQISGQSNLCLGMPFHGRFTAEEKQTPGVLMELFPTQVTIDQGETFSSLLEKVRDSFFQYLRYSVPGSGADAVAQSCNFYFNYLNTVLTQGDGFAEDVSWLHSGATEPTHHFIVKLYNFEGEDQYTLQFDLNDAVFPAEIQSLVVDQFLECFQQCLQNRKQLIGTATPELLSRLKGFHHPSVDLQQSEETVLTRFKSFVEQTPNATALLFEERSMSYWELDQRSNQMARALQDYGLVDGDIVGLCVHRSFLEQIALMAILKAGGVFLPLDPDYPQSRIDFILEDSNASFVIHEESYREKFQVEGITSLEVNALYRGSDYRSPEPLSNTISADHLFHIYYTSGSTGKPKGVLVRHDGVLNCLWGMQHTFPISAADTLVRKTVITFDSAVWESYWPLIMGSKIVIAKHNRQGDTKYIDELMVKHGVTIAYFVAPLLDKYLREGGGFSTVDRVISGGDELKASVVKRFQEKFGHIQLYNYYGPTEGSIGCTAWTMPEGYQPVNPIPIGKPFPGVKIFVLNQDNQHCLIGMPGELCIGGIQVAPGYLNRPELTRSKFETVQIEGEPEAQKLYRTGDLARWTAEGNIEFLGRIDNQVKIRGVRIELGELEFALKAATGVDDCAVIAKVLEGEEKKIIAYLLTNENYDREQIWAYCARELPVYLIPAYLVEVTEIPLLPNGKLDRRSLPLPQKVSATDNQKPSSEFETIIFDEWQAIFPDEQFGINTNFFGLGGHSLTGIRLVNRLNDVFELDMAASVIFQYPTVASLALKIEDIILKLLAELESD